MKKRNINIDLIKCIAVFSVISVHFFANVGLYKNIINSTNMYIGIFFRTLFMICVPLVLILSISLSIIINIIYKIIDKYIVKRLTKLFIK